jgi:hypothetical protein
MTRIEIMGTVTAGPGRSMAVDHSARHRARMSALAPVGAERHPEKRGSMPLFARPAGGIDRSRTEGPFLEERLHTMRAWLMAIALFLPSAVPASAFLGTVTILEGQALVYRGIGRVQAAEGVRLDAGDIVETAPATFAQIELTDRSVLQLGPATRLMLPAAGAKQKPERVLYLLEGWLKIVAGARDTAAGPGFDLRAAQFEVPAGTGVVVLQATSTDLRLFVESGQARVLERQKGPSLQVALHAGDFYQRKAPARGATSPTAPATFVEAIPRPFRDSLPARIDRFRERPTAPREAGAFSYGDVEGWLKAEPAVRRPLMQRWRAKAAEPPFRSALVANLSSHPEWDPILFPEKYRPKEPPAQARPGESPARAASAAP